MITNAEEFFESIGYEFDKDADGFYLESWVGEMKWKELFEYMEEYAAQCKQPEITDLPDEKNIEFYEEVEYMQKLYKNRNYTQAEEVRDKLAEKLDDIMRENN